METIQLADLNLRSSDYYLIVFTGRYLRNAIDEVKRQNFCYEYIYIFPENSVSAYERIDRAKEIYQDSQKRRLVFTFDTYVMDYIFKMYLRDNYAQTVKAYNCVELGYIDLSDNIPEMFRDNSEAMQTLLSIW